MVLCRRFSENGSCPLGSKCTDDHIAEMDGSHVEKITVKDPFAVVLYDDKRELVPRPAFFDVDKPRAKSIGNNGKGSANTSNGNANGNDNDNINSNSNDELQTVVKTILTTTKTYVTTTTTGGHSNTEKRTTVTTKTTTHVRPTKKQKRKKKKQKDPIARPPRGIVVKTQLNLWRKRKQELKREKKLLEREEAKHNAQIHNRPSFLETTLGTNNPRLAWLSFDGGNPNLFSHTQAKTEVASVDRQVQVSGGPSSRFGTNIGGPSIIARESTQHARGTFEGVVQNKSQVEDLDGTFKALALLG